MFTSQFRLETVTPTYVPQKRARRVSLQLDAIAVPIAMALQAIDLLCIATAALTKMRLVMVQVVSRRTDVDALGNAIEHMAIPDKAWIGFSQAFPMLGALWKNDSPGVADSVAGRGQSDDAG